MRCDHFPQCGGCQLLDLDAREECAHKEAVFLGTLSDAGIAAKIASYECSPLYSRRRATLSAKRTKKSAILGFSEARSHQIIDMHMCLVLDPDILALRTTFLELTKKLASRNAIIKIQITKLAHGFDLSVENAKDLEPPEQEFIAKICLQSHIHRVFINGDLIFQDTPARIAIGDHLISIPSHPFLQATHHAQEHLRALAHDAAQDAGQIVDLFAGIGTFSYGLDVPVTAFEGNAEMSLSMQDNLHQMGLHNIKAMHRDLFREPLSPAEFSAFDFVIINPPRAGAKAQCEALARSDVRRIAFISCEAATFARDARILMEGGYKMTPVHLIDQFRFSNHLESFTVFEKPRIRAHQ